MGNKGTRVGGFSLAQLVTGVLTTAVLTFTAFAAASAHNGLGAAKPMDGAQQYGCGDTCYSRYYYCLVAGYTQTYCGAQYSQCLNNCGGGAAARTQDTQ